MIERVDGVKNGDAYPNHQAFPHTSSDYQQLVVLMVVHRWDHLVMDVMMEILMDRLFGRNQPLSYLIYQMFEAYIRIPVMHAINSKGRNELNTVMEAKAMNYTVLNGAK
jgi:uncharacterized SAM-binding protein YcdF (DUF218 family)